MPVLLSCDNNIVVFNQYSKLALLDIAKRRGGGNDFAVLGNPHAYVRNWGAGLLEYNGITAHIYSYQTEYMVKKRVHNALSKLIEKEYGAYGSMSDRLSEYLKESI